ncbi:MAG TPA: lysophospholipid acyltransferase family protein [Candidatus Angelobacter sp.]|nr:lysophospholipid acyltransferase family protein [Candidatus Angelobacter sp.]
MGSSAQSELKVDSESARRFTFGERIKLWLISWAGYLLVRSIGATLRYELHLEPGCLAEGFDNPPLAIWCFWHRCVIPATYRLRKNKIAVMTSRSFDGEYIARIIQKLGYVPVRGSSSRGGAAALLGMRAQLEQGHAVAFTIDGPRGPRFIAKPGPVVLARKTGVPISCFYIAVERAWILNSWDRMMIPKPFSRTAVYASSPIIVPPDANDEKMAELHGQMQEALERCRMKAEAVFSKNI